jgi:5-methyltetrahydropteroyltriglutamate--homocysteine methyltransferase
MNSFQTQEIGSLPKFSWRVKPIRGIELSDRDIETAKRWAEELALDSKELLKILSKRKNFTEKEKRRIVEYSMLYAIAMEERAGLDIVWSGEQARTEMYETPVSNIKGFEFIGRVRSFDNKYWRIASIKEKPRFLRNYHKEEFLFTKKNAKRRIKVPVTDPITIMAWSDNYYYTRKYSKVNMEANRKSFSARREFSLDLAKIIRSVLRELIEFGAEEIQLDIPAATQYQTEEDIKVVVEAFNETTSGLNARFSVHSCFPPRIGYSILFPHILEMKKCVRFSFEYANRDTFARGINEDARHGYRDVMLFREYGYNRELGIGVIHVHTDKLPSAEIVRDRILYAAKVSGLGPEKIYVNPDCGLRTRSPDVAYSMLKLVVKGAELARSSLKR